MGVSGHEIGQTEAANTQTHVMGVAWCWRGLFVVVSR